jgi:hypothetical protein
VPGLVPGRLGKAEAADFSSACMLGVFAPSPFQSGNVAHDQGVLSNAQWAFRVPHSVCGGVFGWGTLRGPW